ncbi:MAG TPA: hypothetical protein VH394_18630, partial [Thermoanaerobaculia bacterium]|nr:hypothetical protein [Thermoanaerobaculia bacterium]
DLAAEIDHLENRERALAQLRSQSRPFHIFQNEVIGFLSGEKVVNVNDIGMIQPGGETGLPAKPFLLVWPRGILADAFDCHLAVELLVVGEENLSHSSEP